jgi:vitamin B12 transport system substrate-binding protein
VFDDLGPPAPQVSLEAVLQRAPDLIVAGSTAQLAMWKAWPQLKARKLVLPDKGLERPSGQMIEAVATLCAAISPDR